MEKDCQTKNRKPFVVLSLDGGGMRGLYTATLLQRLAGRFVEQNKTVELDIGKGFDLIVGTSTGGILATALAYGLSINDIIEMYRKVGPKIFMRPQPQRLLPFLWWSLGSFFKPANSAAPLKEKLDELFGNETVARLYDRRKIGLCLTSVKLLDEKFRVFKTPHLPKKDLDNQYKLVDICLATSAAPIFLPLAGIASPQDPLVIETYADGGLAANNPVLIGLIEAMLVAEKDQPIHILSVGTCSAPEGNVLKSKDLRRGLLKWKAGAKALTLAMNAQASSADFAAHFLAKCLSQNGREIKIIRFPEARRSEAHLKFLQMDLASEDALLAFSSFGADDAIEAYRLCQEKDSNEDGRIISGVFQNMPPLQTPERKSL